MVLQPNFWASADYSNEIIFDAALLVSDEAIEISGEYTMDLDLVYT